MDLMTPREKNHRLQKEKIFCAAKGLIEEYGIEYATVKNICEKAGISNGSFFHYFKSKEELLAYYFEEGFQEFLDGKIEKYSECSDYKNKIIEAYALYGRYCQRSGLAFVSNYYSTKNKALNSKATRHNNNTSISIEPIATDISAAQAAGYVSRNVDPRDAACDICMLLKGIIFDWCVSDGCYDMEPKIRKILKMYLDTLSA